MLNLKNISRLLIVVTLPIFVFTSCKTLKNTSSAGLQKSLLWRIEGPGIKLPSYLFGTIHIIDAKDYFLPKGTLTAIDASKKMMFEIDIKEMTDMGNLAGMMSKIMMKDGKTLKDIITADEYTMVNDHFKKLGLPMFMFERMKPFFLTLFAQEGMDPSGLQNGKMKSYEMEFSELATEKDLLSGGLETIEFQMSLFDEISYEDQAKMLVDAIKSNGQDDDSFKTMIALYKQQDVEELANLIDEEGGVIKDFNEKLLVNRNKNWIDNIITESKNQTTFIAVGAGHLGGKDGVIRLLRARGYKVTPY
jgi:uncharacterized protein